MLLPDINIAIFKFHGKYTSYNIAAHQLPHFGLYTAIQQFMNFHLLYLSKQSTSILGKPNNPSHSQRLPTILYAKFITTP